MWCECTLGGSRQVTVEHLTFDPPRRPPELFCPDRRGRSTLSRYAVVFSPGGVVRTARESPLAPDGRRVITSGRSDCKCRPPPLRRGRGTPMTRFRPRTCFHPDSDSLAQIRRSDVVTFQPNHITAPEAHFPTAASSLSTKSSQGEIMNLAAGGLCVALLFFVFIFFTFRGVR